MSQAPVKRARGKAGKIGARPPPEYKRLAIGAVVPYGGNPRTHSPAQVAEIAGAITRWGFANPLLVDEVGGLIAGHGRLLAAQLLGLAEVPVIVLAGLSETEKRALAIADNKLGLNSAWDDDLLRVELLALKDVGFDLAMLGFSGDELAGVFGSLPGGGRTDPDAVPPLEPVEVSRRGDVWLLGRHRLVCGDSTTALSVGQALGKLRPNLMVTDPPYGVDYNPGWRDEALPVDGSVIGGRAVGKVGNDDRADWGPAWRLFPGNVAYVWHAGMHADVVIQSLQQSGFGVRAQIIWVKTRHVISRGHYHVQHEPALYAVREGAEDGWRFEPDHEPAFYAVRKGESGEWQGGRKQSTVWFIEHLKSDTGHGTQKPVACMQRPIENNSKRGDAVFDPFTGSGTTCVACTIVGRLFVGIELDPKYVDLSVRRWQNFCGENGILEETGETFEEVTTRRGAAASVPAAVPAGAR